MERADALGLVVVLRCGLLLCTYIHRSRRIFFSAGPPSSVFETAPIVPPPLPGLGPTPKEHADLLLGLLSLNADEAAEIPTHASTGLRGKLSCFGKRCLHGVAA